MNRYCLRKIAGILAKYSQAYHCLGFDDVAITLFNQQSSTVHPYDSISGNIKIKKGTFFFALEWKEVNGDVIIFDWLNPKIARQLQNQINIKIDSCYKQYFSEYAEDIVGAHQNLESLYKKDRYLRYSSTQEWLENNRKIREILVREERAEYLDKTTNNYANELRRFFVNPEAARAKRNRHYVQQKYESYGEYFDRIESNPLTESQRKACVEDDDANLVLAGAGTGKTSTMVGKAGYLIESGLARPEQILMLAFARKAAEEMQERIEKRIGVEGLTVKTFHSLGKAIIAEVEGKQPSLSKMAEDDSARVRFVDDTLADLIQSDVYRIKLFNYFANYLYPVKNIFDFKSKKEYIEFCQQVELRTLNGDLVKSHEELIIANYLYQQGVRYEYEANYKIDTSGPDYRRYRPDFYFPDYEIYIEHFAVNEKGETPGFIDQKTYLEGMEWKRSLHKQYGTRLLESYSYEHRQGRLLENLQQKLLSAGVIFQPLPESKILETIKALGEATSFSQLISEFLKLFKSAFLGIKELYDLASKHVDRTRMMIVVELFKPIYQRYQAYLAARTEIDFEDMIAKSILYVEEGRFASPYRYILVDEFQDISASRARLIKALKNQHRDNSIFCVGDDWQSIYRFTGSDVALTRDFPDHFGVAAINILDLTFRFNQRIGQVAARFIQKNPAQIRKEIKSLRNVNSTAVTLILDISDADGLARALEEIGKKASQGESVLVLGRYKYTKPDGFSKIKRQYQQLHIDYMTVHAAKGREADYVIVLGLVNGKNGFPSARVSNSILSILLPHEEDYQYAEERRLFYVALTRARHHVYLVSHPDKASEFVRELRNEKYPVVVLTGGLTSNISWGEEILCPDCQSGYLVPRTNKTNESRFYACNAWPYCEYTQNACPDCGGQLVKESNHYRCVSEICDHVSPLCPACGGRLVLKDGQYGKFWGCNNYRVNSCKYKTKHVDVESLRNRSNDNYKNYIT